MKTTTAKTRKRPFCLLLLLPVQSALRQRLVATDKWRVCTQHRRLREPARSDMNCWAGGGIMMLPITHAGRSGNRRKKLSKKHLK